jgi:RNA polymerase sigma-70 factor, ECF subfamily
MYPFLSLQLYTYGAMEIVGTLERAASEAWTDLEIVERVKAGDTALYEIIMRRYNQRLYRVARAILRDDAEAEDVMQDAYVRAYQHLHQFAARAPFSSWLTRIAVHEALGRLRLRKRNPQLDDTEYEGELSVNVVETSPNPEQSASRAELGQLLEEALLDLPEQYRTVVMLRDIEELSTSETAEALDLTEHNVKVRLHRGRAMARGWLFARVGANAKNAFPFMGVRCDRVVQGVFARVAALSTGHSQIQ